MPFTKGNSGNPLPKPKGFLMKNLILTLIITLPLTLWGQVWENAYLFGYPNHIIETNDDNLLISFLSSL